MLQLAAMYRFRLCSQCHIVLIEYVICSLVSSNSRGSIKLGMRTDKEQRKQPKLMQRYPGCQRKKDFEFGQRPISFYERIVLFCPR